METNKMINTISDLKRKLQKGQGLKLVRYGLNFKVNDAHLNVVRYVIKTQGNGIYLNADKNAVKGSFLEFPKASLCEVNDNGFKTFLSGERDLTEEEKKILENVPKDEEQANRDIMTDSNTMFYREKAYFKEKGFEYLFGGNSKVIKGLYFLQDRNKIRDDNLKGDLSLEYEFVEDKN